MYDGTIIWRKNLDKECTCPIKVIDDVVLIVVNDKTILFVDCVDCVDGSIANTSELKDYSQKDNVKIKRIVNSNKGIFFVYDENLIGFPNILEKPGVCWVESLPTVTWEEYYGGVYNGISFDNKYLCSTCSNGAIVCINSKTGSIVWKIETCEKPSIPFIFEEYVCFMTDAGFLYMCDKKNGSTQKKIRINNVNYGRNDEYNYGIPIVTYSCLVLFQNDNVTLYNINNITKTENLNVGDCYYNYQYDYLDLMALPTFCNNKLLISSPNGIDAF